MTMKRSKNLRGRHRFGALLLGIALSLMLLPSSAEGSGRSDQLDRWDPETPSPTGQSVAVHCNALDDSDPETWPEATASVRLIERSGRSKLTFVVRDARPDTLFTVWLRLAGEDSEGNPFGGSPLTGFPVTPLAASTDLPAQLEATLPNPGSQELSNGFRTNHRGHGRITLHLDFPINSGAYPFHRFPDFETHKTDIALTNDANLARLGGAAPSIKPVAIPDGSQAPATILIASHCVDDTGHGLIPGPHENWFTWAAG
jgi:hypothetical protein